MNFKSIKAKLITTILIPGIILILMLVFYSPYQASSMGNEISRKNSEFITKILADNLSIGLQAMILDDGASLKETLKLLSNTNDKEFATISDVKVFDTDKKFLYSLSNDDAKTVSYDKSDELQFEDTDDNIKYFSPIKDAASNEILGYVEVDFSKSYLNSQTNDMQNSSFLIGLILLLSIVLISYFIAQSISKPVIAMKNAADEVAGGNYDIKLNTTSKDETGRLSKAFTEMALNLKNLMAQMDQREKELEAQQHEMKILMEESDKQKKYLEESAETLLVEMHNFAQGDLTVSVEVKNNDAIGKLFEGFNTAVKNIREMIGMVDEVVHSTATAANQISANINDMASGSAVQTQKTAEVNNSIQEISQVIFDNSAQVSKAADISQDASEKANNGSQKILETKAEMERIVSSTGSSTQKIETLTEKIKDVGQIAELIDDIADQTNLLALNAAIEAARAGEQGRGFAVVADEVRKLAERTTKATKEIADSIRAIQGEAVNAKSSIEEANTFVKNGMKLVEDVRSLFENILASSNEVSNVISFVASSSEEQSASAEEMKQHINEITDISNEVTSGSDQIAKASDGLTQLTTSLMEVISKFKKDSNVLSVSNTNQNYLRN